MQRYIVIVVLGLLTTQPAFATTWADGLFDGLSRDFGSVPRGPVISHPFRIVNNTRSTVRISNVRVSCGCVTAYALKQTLKPGEDTAVVAKMDTSRFSNSRTVTIFVRFDQPGYAEVRLWVRANSRQDVNVYPSTLGYGRVKRGETPEKATKIALRGSSAYRILKVESESNFVQPKLTMVSKDAYGVNYQLSAKLRSDTPPGRWYSDLWVTTNNPALPKVRIPLTMEIQSNLVVTPSVVRLGNVKMGGEKLHKVIVRGVEPFKIKDIKGTDKHLVAYSGSDQARKIHVVTVTYRPQKVGPLNRVLYVMTDLKTDNSIDLTIRAHAVQ
ncbi:MAG: DUF1573 domain-containing protein [Gemmataceae bacterium]